MSADYWQGCPWCLEDEPNVDITDPENPTMRVDYEMYVDSDKNVHMSFHCSCDVCDRGYLFTKVVPLTEELRIYDSWSFLQD